MRVKSVSDTGPLSFRKNRGRARHSPRSGLLPCRYRYRIIHQARLSNAVIPQADVDMSLMWANALLATSS